MRVSILVAGALAVGAVVWVASGQVDAPRPQAGADDAPAAKAGEEPPAAVRVRRTVAVARERAIVVNGRTEESRRVTVRAETAGPVVRAPAEEGRPVAPRQVIARLGVEDRKARLEEAEALLRQREIEHQAASRLASKGFRSNAGLAEARARLDAAKARVSAIRTDIARTTVRAPFAGILETRHVETGDFLKVGERGRVHRRPRPVSRNVWNSGTPSGVGPAPVGALGIPFMRLTKTRKISSSSQPAPARSRSVVMSTRFRRRRMKASPVNGE